MQPLEGDALGLALLAELEGESGWHVLERDDGRVEAMDAVVYFRPPSEWPEGEPRVLDQVRGRALDVGAGAGRYALELRDRGHDVVALDISPGAIEVCRRRGLVDLFTGPIAEFDDEEGFDTFVFGGHNLGLLEGPEAVPHLLEHVERLARPGARIVGTCRDPYDTDDPENLEYHDLNRSRGRQPGQVRFRVRYRRVTTPWFDYWFMSPEELGEAVSLHGWNAVETEPLAFGSYMAVLESSS